jgi:integrase
MRRKRYQKGSVRPRKHGRFKVWVAQWWDNGSKKSRVLGRCCDIPKAQADVMMAEILEPINERAGQRTATIYTFRRYMDEVFLPVYRRKWKESTRMSSESAIQTHLTPEFGNKLLREIKREHLQAFLDTKAETHSHSIVDHLRWHFSAIFKMAMGDGAVDFNPTIGLYTPPCKPAAVKKVMTKDQILKALTVLELRERLVFRMALFDGMRPGEILAIRLRNIGESSLYIDQRLYKGNLDTPKGRKGKRTERTIGLSPGTVTDLNRWRSQLRDQSPEAYLFPSERLNGPARLDNIWRRYIQPRLESLGLEWATFQVLRRTNASLSRKAKIDDKVSADQRGHTLGVSLEVYSISDLEQKIDAVTRLESEVIQ